MVRKEFRSMTREMERLVYQGNESAIRQKLAKGVSINCYDNSSQTSLLMWSSAWGWLNLVIKLIEEGAEFKNYQNCEGNTALMDAAFYGHQDVVKLLVEKGAKINLKDRAGSTAMDWAVRTKNWKILKMLIDAGGKYNIPIPEDANLEQVVVSYPEVEEADGLDDWLDN
jgi:uncharacterized protein